MSAYDLAFPSVDAALVTGATPPSNFNAATLTSQLARQEQASLANAIDGAETNSGNALRYGVLLSRDRTINDIATSMMKNNERLTGGARDTYTRQGEINEWAAQNKLDTLFFLQITFLYFCVMIVLFFLRQSEMIPSGVVYGVGGVLLLIVFFILWNRASYTQTSRDKRYWNRRFIGIDDVNLTSEQKCVA